MNDTYKLIEVLVIQRIMGLSLQLKMLPGDIALVIILGILCDALI